MAASNPWLPDFNPLPGPETTLRFLCGVWRSAVRFGSWLYRFIVAVAKFADRYLNIFSPECWFRP